MTRPFSYQRASRRFFHHPWLLPLLLSLLMLFPWGARAEEFLDPAIAFKPTAQAIDGQTIEVRFEIAKGYYLYRDKFRFTAEPESVQLGTPILPPGKVKQDPNFGDVEVYYQQVLIRIPVERNSSGPLPLSLKLTSQGCADAGICYPPQRQTLRLELPDPATTPATGATTPGQDFSNDESGRIAQLFKNASFWLLVASFFGFGLLLSLTPCCFPMIPILSSIIVGSGRDGHGVSHARGFSLSLAYVLGMAITYAAAGVAAGLTGTLLTAALQNAWVLGAFALVFVALSLSMFGFYELQLPTFLQSKVSEEASHLRGGSLPGVAAMGVLSAIIVGPCVAAPLAGALLYIGRSGDAVLGGTALFAMGLGMGAPLLAVGLSAGTLLPRSGPMDGGGQEIFWRAPASHCPVAACAGHPGRRANDCLGLAADHPGDLPARARPAAAARQGLAALLERYRDLHAHRRRGDAARCAGRLTRPAAAAVGAAQRCGRGRSPATALHPRQDTGRTEKPHQERWPAGDARLLRRLVRVLQGDGTFHLFRCARACPAGRLDAAASRRHRQLGRRQGTSASFQSLWPARNHLL
jgi:cytochrome c biogenesis protein CcdA